jgi:2-polyprenyl-6-hydroxyphenyl methylase/3-demethylubiquinone-9 3-methyltransferase
MAWIGMAWPLPMACLRSPTPRRIHWHDELVSARVEEHSLKPVADPRPAACKVCTGPSPLFGVVDFNKSCLEAQNRRLPLSGSPVYYRRCQQCGFTFTSDFDSWTPAAFKRHIYNERYIEVDPDFAEARPAQSAAWVAQTFQDAKDSIRVLDYGGGDGVLAERLRAQAFTASTYDPFSRFNDMPQETFDLITCFEVMEHVPNPKATVATILSLLRRPGVLVFSTLVQPESFLSMGLSWWYAAPRNGHISLYTKPALARLFQAHGLKCGSFSDNLHIAYAEVPAFAAHLNLP